MPSAFIITDDAGNARVVQGIREMQERTEFGVQKGLWLMGKDLRKEFRRASKEKRFGRAYRFGNRTIRASKPGETPAKRSGDYRRGGDFNVSGQQLEFGNSTKHALYLENGTSRMKPRPGLNNAIKAREGELLSILADKIENQL